jgi:hypothetical protein
LYSLRVWLRAGQVDHRLFADEIWIGKNPDFRAIGDASFAQLTGGAPFMLVYQGLVGKARVNFIIRFATMPLVWWPVLLKCVSRWNLCEGDMYKISLEYEAGGVGSILFDDFCIHLDTECDPQAIAFVV